MKVFLFESLARNKTSNAVHGFSENRSGLEIAGKAAFFRDFSGICFDFKAIFA